MNRVSVDAATSAWQQIRFLDCLWAGRRLEPVEEQEVYA